MTFLEQIIESTRERVLTAKRARPAADLKRRVRDLEGPRPFAAALTGTGDVRLIAEVKRASPSQGILRERFDPVEIARIYEEEGAAAISVLTEERFFKGSLETLGRIRGAVKRPLLRKDFILDEYQVFEARAFEADAILLIAAILDDSPLRDYQALAADLGMDCLLEVHTGEELARALKSGGRVLGINNRDLATFKTDLDISLRLIPDIPDHCWAVSESGIAGRNDIHRLEEAGMDAVLIGETFMKAPDIRAKIRELFGDDVKR